MCSQKCGSAVATALSGIAMVLFVANAWLVNSGQALQRQVADRQAQISNAVQLSQLNGEMIRTLGTAVVGKNDAKIKDMLARHGITVTPDKDAGKDSGKDSGKDTGK